MAETKAPTPVVYHTLPALPYALNALHPHISELMMSFHYGKHHKAYVDKLNEFAQTNEVLRKSVDELLVTLEPGKPLNQVAQIWNHSFYWTSMSPNGGKEPTGDMEKSIQDCFGSFDKFKNDFSLEAAGHFGSGWAWLIYKDEKLQIISTHDAGNPLCKDASKDAKDPTKAAYPILACDVWEHAYYIDFKNSRVEYLKAWWNLVNWEFANKNLANAKTAIANAKRDIENASKKETK